MNAKGYLTYALYTLISTLATSIALWLIGYSLTTIGWFAIASGMSVFFIPIAILKPVTFDLWIWYYLILLWVGRFAVFREWESEDD